MQEINYNDAKIRFFERLTRDRKVLDLGVVQHKTSNIGDPNWLHRAIVRSSRQCLGLDIDKDGVDYMQSQGFSVVCADAQQFDLNDTYDVICAGDLIEHLSNVGGFLDSVRRHLAPEGHFAISTPSPFWWKMTAFVLLKGRAPVHPQHTCWYCEQTLRQVLERHGFEITEVKFGSIYNSTSLWHKVTRLLTLVLPLPAPIRHNTMMIAAKKAGSP